MFPTHTLFQRKTHLLCPPRTGEKNVDNTKFVSLPSSLWFAVVSGLTVGYGDITPTTAPGQAFTLLMLSLVVALYAISPGIIGYASRCTLRRTPMEDCVLTILLIWCRPRHAQACFDAADTLPCPRLPFPPPLCRTSYALKYQEHKKKTRKVCKGQGGGGFTEPGSKFFAYRAAESRALTFAHHAAPVSCSASTEWRQRLPWCRCGGASRPSNAAAALPRRSSSQTCMSLGNPAQEACVDREALCTCGSSSSICFLCLVTA